MNRIISRKMWHEVIDDELDYELVNLGAELLASSCVDERANEQYYRKADHFEEFCRRVIDRTVIPDNMSYNQVLTVLDVYLHERWEEYNHEQN